MAQRVIDNRSSFQDYLRLQDSTGKALTVFEILSQVNEILNDASNVPANGTYSNRVSVRSSLPTVQFGKVNKGTPRSKGSWTQLTDPMGFIDGLSEVDTRQREVQGEELFAKERWTQDQGFLEAIAQLHAQTILYGNTKTNEAAFDGIFPRIPNLQTSDMTKSLVFGAGGSSTDNASVLVVDWGERGASLCHPPNTAGGIQSRDKGEQRVTDGAGDPFMAAVTSYILWTGFTLGDRRHLGAVRNVDISDAQGSSPANPILPLLAILTTKMPPAAGMNRVIYGPADIVAAWWIQAFNKGNLALSIQDYLGAPMLHYQQWPVRRVDQMLTNDGTIT